MQAGHGVSGHCLVLSGAQGSDVGSFGRPWTITATADRAGCSPLAYLRGYLDACAQAGGKAPEGAALARFFPLGRRRGRPGGLALRRRARRPHRHGGHRHRRAPRRPRAGAVSAQPGSAGPVRYCGREFSPADIELITGLAAELPTRAAIAGAACQALDWRRPDGQAKAMSARVAPNRMAAGGLLTLPPPAQQQRQRAPSPLPPR